MPTGTLKMWNAERGYGFIADDAGGPDMFLHISALQAAGIDPENLRKGDRLSNPQLPSLSRSRLRLSSVLRSRDRVAGASVFLSTRYLPRSTLTPEQMQSARL